MHTLSELPWPQTEGERLGWIAKQYLHPDDDPPWTLEDCIDFYVGSWLSHIDGIFAPVTGYTWVTDTDDDGDFFEAKLYTDWSAAESISPAGEDDK